jgi:hypothetical protein
MQSTNARLAFRRTSRTSLTTRARLITMLEENSSREYRAILADIGDRQCDSLANFAMAEHMRSLMAAPGRGT